MPRYEKDGKFNQAKERGLEVLAITAEVLAIFRGTANLVSRGFGQVKKLNPHLVAVVLVLLTTPHNSSGTFNRRFFSTL